MVDYSVVIPAYNEQDYLPDTLQALGRAMAAVAGRGEVIVVDNGSTDGTAQVALALGARVVHEPHRQIARARNAGGCAATGRYLVFLDADTHVTPAAFKAALDAMRSGHYVGGGARMVFDENAGLDVEASLYLWMILSKFMRWAAGGYLFCRKDAFDQLCGFDERYYAGEELHFSRALRHWGERRGLGMIILPDAVVTSARKVRWFSRMEMGRMSLRLALDMRRTQSREECMMWYERPEGRNGGR